MILSLISNYNAISDVYNSDIKKDEEVEQEDTWAVKVMDDLSIREKYFTKRIDWNINEEISEEILKAAEKYNKYVTKPMSYLHAVIKNI